MSDELLPCPFCGGAAQVVTATERPGSSYLPWVWVECKDCWAQSDSDKDTGIAIAAWNRRAAPKPASHDRSAEP